ncbi:MAG: GFA family protein [Pseudomonadales bacterium]
MSHSGQCLCGAVKFSADDVETHFHSCHCGMCRRWSGGPGMAVGVGSVKFADESHISRYASSDWAERGFCSSCGTNLFYHMKEPGRYIMWLGTFDDQTPFEIAGEIYIDSKPDSYALAGDHPRQTEAEFMAAMGITPE